MKSHRFLGTRVDDVTMAEVLEQISHFIQSRKPHQIATVNAEFIMSARDDHAFRRVINNSDIATADGAGVMLVGKLTGKSVRQRVTGADLTMELANLSAQNGWSLFLLGALPGVAEQAAQNLQRLYPKLKIAGTLSNRPGEADNDTICAKVEAAHPDILLVAYGPPLQDLWISRNQPRLQIPVAIGVGGTFDYIAGTIKRAPRLMQLLGLEWLWRLLQEPWRWRRMLALPRFVVLSLLEAIGLVRP